MKDFLGDCWGLLTGAWGPEVQFIMFVGVLLGAGVSVGAAWIWSFFL